MLPPWDVKDVLAVRASAWGWRGSRPSASLVTHAGRSASLVTHAASASFAGLALGLGLLSCSPRRHSLPGCR